VSFRKKPQRGTTRGLPQLVALVTAISFSFSIELWINSLPNRRALMPPTAASPVRYWQYYLSAS